jgi:hypothetical protein
LLKDFSFQTYCSNPILGNARSENIRLRWGDFAAGFTEAIPFGARIALSRLSLVDLWLGLLLGAGSSMERSGDGDDEGFYRCCEILVLGIDRTPRKFNV